MGLIEQIKKKQKSNYRAGSFEKIFEYNDKCARDESGMLPTIIKLDPIESKKKKSIN